MRWFVVKTKKRVLVHVVLPDGTRHEFPFNADTPDEKILAELARAKRRFGTARTVRKTDRDMAERGVDVKAEYDDPSGGFLYDDPATVVLVGVDSGDGRGEFVERRRIKGPPEKEDRPAGPDAKPPG